MSNNQQKIEHYLAELNSALQGQSTSLIQDALYDAENHILDTLAEEKGATFDAIVTEYGSAEDVAQQYIALEAQTQQFLLGKRRKHRANGFFEPLFDPSCYKAMGYFIISWPLSVAYFAWFAIGGLSVLSLSLVGVGIPLLALYLKLQSYVALFEGQLVTTLLDGRMPRRPFKLLSNAQPRSTFQKIKSYLKTPLGWKTTLYTAIQLPLTSVYFAVCAGLFFASFALMISPIVDPIIHYLSPSHKIDIAWYWIPLCIPAGLISLTLSLYIASALSKLQNTIARALLVN